MFQDKIKTTTMAPTPIPNPRPTKDGTNQDGTTQDPNISKSKCFIFAGSAVSEAKMKSNQKKVSFSVNGTYK